MADSAKETGKSVVPGGPPRGSGIRDAPATRARETNPATNLAPSTPLFVDNRDEEGLRMTLEQERRAYALQGGTGAGGPDNGDKKRALLFAYCRTGTVAGACSMLKDEDTGRPLVSKYNHDDWMKNDPDYRALYEELRSEVDAMWELKLLQKADRGIEDRTYDGNGNLKYRRVREDAGLLKMIAAARLPEYRDNDSGVQIAVVIERPSE